MKTYNVAQTIEMEKFPNIQSKGWIKGWIIEGPNGGNYLFYRHQKGFVRQIAGNTINSRARKSAYEFVEAL